MQGLSKEVRKYLDSILRGFCGNLSARYLLFVAFVEHAKRSWSSVSARVCIVFCIWSAVSSLIAQERLTPSGSGQANSGQEVGSQSPPIQERFDRSALSGLRPANGTTGSAPTAAEVAAPLPNGSKSVPGSTATALQPPAGNLPIGNLTSPSPAPPSTTTVTPVPLQATPPVASPPSTLTQEAILARQQQLQALTDIDATIKQTLTQLYESIVVELRARFENERQAKEFAVMAEAAPAATQAAKSKKESPTQFDFALADRLMFYSVEELQKELQRLQSALQAIVDQRTRVEAALTTRESRRKELPKLQNEERELLRKLTDEMALPGANETDPRVGEAQRLLIQARRETSLELLKKMEAELRAYEAENELLPLRRDRFLAEEKQLQSRVKEITDELNKRRESLIQTERRKLRRSLRAHRRSLRRLRIDWSSERMIGSTWPKPIRSFSAIWSEPSRPSRCGPSVSRSSRKGSSRRTPSRWGVSIHWLG